MSGNIACKVSQVVHLTSQQEQPLSHILLIIVKTIVLYSILTFKDFIVISHYKMQGIFIHLVLSNVLSCLILQCKTNKQNIIMQVFLETRKVIVTYIVTKSHIITKYWSIIVCVTMCLYNTQTLRPRSTNLQNLIRCIWLPHVSELHKSYIGCGVSLIQVIIIATSNPKEFVFESSVTMFQHHRDLADSQSSSQCKDQNARMSNKVIPYPKEQLVS